MKKFKNQTLRLKFLRHFYDIFDLVMQEAYWEYDGKYYTCIIGFLKNGNPVYIKRVGSCYSALYNVLVDQLLLIIEDGVEIFPLAGRGGRMIEEIDE